MTYVERTKAFCASILLILKNATIVIPVLEGIVYTVIDLIKTQKKIAADKEKLIVEQEIAQADRYNKD